MTMDKITEDILKEITDYDKIFSGAYSLRENGECISFRNSDNIRIVKSSGTSSVIVSVVKKSK